MIQGEVIGDVHIGLYLLEIQVQVAPHAVRPVVRFHIRLQGGADRIVRCGDRAVKTKPFVVVYVQVEGNAEAAVVVAVPDPVDIVHVPVVGMGDVQSPIDAFGERSAVPGIGIAVHISVGIHVGGDPLSLIVDRAAAGDRIVGRVETSKQIDVLTFKDFVIAGINAELMVEGLPQIRIADQYVERVVVVRDGLDLLQGRVHGIPVVPDFQPAL